MWRHRGPLPFGSTTHRPLQCWLFPLVFTSICGVSGRHLPVPFALWLMGFPAIIRQGGGDADPALASARMGTQWSHSRHATAVYRRDEQVDAVPDPRLATTLTLCPHTGARIAP